MVMTLQQLIYNSAATRPLNEVELSRILLGARRRNDALGVTGMLLYHEGAFLQVLEGEEQTVGQLFERISEDPRHRRVAVLLRRRVDARQFGEWSMGFMDVKGVAEALPGYSDYLKSRDDPGRAGSLAAKILEQFCEGQLRPLVASR